MAAYRTVRKNPTELAVFKCNDLIGRKLTRFFVFVNVFVLVFVYVFV